MTRWQAAGMGVLLYTITFLLYLILRELGDIHPLTRVGIPLAGTIGIFIMANGVNNE